MKPWQSPFCNFLDGHRQFHFLGQIRHFIWIVADHQAYDVVGALLIEAMLIVEGEWLSLLSIASALKNQPFVASASTR